MTLTVECVDRVYLNADVPRLQWEGGVVGFLLHRGQKIPSPAVFGQITQAFKTGPRAWADERESPWLEFTKGQRKDDLVQPYRDRFAGTDGVVLIRSLHSGPSPRSGPRPGGAPRRSAAATSTSATAGPRSASAITPSTSSTRRGDRASSRSAATRPTP